MAAMQHSCNSEYQICLHMCVAVCRSFFDKIKLEFADILEANKVDMNNVSLTFQRVLQFPLRRTLEYQKLLSTIADLYPAVSMTSSLKLCVVFVSFHCSHYHASRILIVIIYGLTCISVRGLR